MVMQKLLKSLKISQSRVTVKYRLRQRAAFFNGPQCIDADYRT